LQIIGKENKMQDKIELGDLVKCRVTGFKGVVTGYTKYIHGCDRATVQPAVDKDGKYPDAWAIDILALDIVKKGAGLPKTKSTYDNKFGGPAEKVRRY